MQASTSAYHYIDFSRTKGFTLYLIHILRAGTGRRAGKKIKRILDLFILEIFTD